MIYEQLEGKNKEALLLAAKIMSECGLENWHINIKDVTSFHGQTRYTPKLITYSSRFIRVATKEQFVGVTYHEIAHALVGRKHGHDRVFKEKYYELTGNMDYAGHSAHVNTKKYLTQCGSCGCISSTNNNKLKRWCLICWKETRKAVLVTITPNPLTLLEWAKS